ncbi:hypothetical protein FQR65_LT00906 [Abscondita terminalis]|nr:hypothetical protein FQR65_LT00906 [Abscondita terminalis]
MMTNTQVKIPCHLQTIIEEIFTQHHIESKTLTVRLPLKPGDNWMGTVYEIEASDLNNQSKIASLSLIAKLAPTVQLYRDFFPVRSSYEREIYTYNEILPEFFNLQKENNIKNTFAPFPKCFKTLSKDTEEVIVLENMLKREYKSLNNRHSANYQVASLIMTNLGKLHALSFALRNQKPELFKKIGVNTEDSFFHSHFGDIYLKIVHNLGQEVLNSLKKDTRAYETFAKFIEDPSFVIDVLLTSKCAGKYAVICHGDPQIRNMLFKYENKVESDTPKKVCFLDWQLCKLGNPCLDIAFFIWTCTDKKLRDCHYDGLLEIYYSSLSTFLRSFGECPETCYPRDVFKDNLKQFSVYGLFASLWVILTNVVDTKNFPNVHSAKTSECLIDMLSTVSDSTYLDRMRDIINDFVDYGYNMHG